jgi:parvulin-like peptidyl-prolyl isomerase
MPFEEVARRFSQDVQTAQMGGAVPGEFSAGDLPAELDGPLSKLKVGEVSAVLPFQGSYEILKVTAIRPTQRAPFEQEKASLEGILKNFKRGELQTAFINDLKKKRRFVVDSLAVKKLAGLMQHPPGDTMPAFPPPYLNEPMARFEGGPYTVGDMLNDVRRTSMMNRPNLADETVVARYAENGAMYPMLIAEARSLKLERDARVQAALKQQREEVLSRAVVMKLLGANPHPSDDELRTEYEKRMNEFVNGGQAQVLEIVTPALQDAQRAAGEARANVPFVTLQKRYSKPTPEEALAEGTLRVIFDGKEPALEDSLRGRAPGQVVGPVALNGRYHVMQVRDVAPAMNMSFDEARMTLLQRVSRERQKQTVDSHIAELKKRWPPKINVRAMLAAKPAKPAPVAGGR